MRELKFRAWLECKDKELNHMIYDRISMCNIIRDHIRGYRMVDNEGFYAFHKENSATYYIMQYTGMNDYNGQEIYEGDILEHKGKSYLVEFKYGEFTATRERVDNIDDRVKDFNNLRNFLHNNKVIVTGNIYENHKILINI